MFDEIKAFLSAQLGTTDSPVMRLANAVQDAVVAVTGDRDDASIGSVGRLPEGPAPSAAEVRAAPLTTPGKVDHAAAQRYADATLASIDWSKPEISLWVPGTGSHEIPASWRDAVAASDAGPRTSLALVDYPATMAFNSSASTGMETLRLVLAGIAEHGGNHRVTVAGHSQGAWVAGDAIAQPGVGELVDEAVLFGHPSTARIDWSSGAEPRVREVDDPADPITRPLAGGQQAVAALDDLVGAAGAPDDGFHPLRAAHDIATVARAALRNPGFATYLLGHGVTPDSWTGSADPHDYQDEYADGAQFLASAHRRPPAATQPVAGTVVT